MCAYINVSSDLFSGEKTTLGFIILPKIVTKDYNNLQENSHPSSQEQTLFSIQVFPNPLIYPQGFPTITVYLSSPLLGLTHLPFTFSYKALKVVKTRILETHIYNS